MSGIKLSALSASDLQAVLAQVDEMKAAEAVVIKAQNEKMRSGVKALVEYLTSGEFQARKFDSGAVGFQAGGKDFVGADGKKYRVSVLVRDESTIPVKVTTKVSTTATKTDAIIAGLQADLASEDEPNEE